MKLYVKNMVCSRCRMIVKEQFHQAGLVTRNVELGEVEVDVPPDNTQLQQLKAGLIKYGFELIDDKKSRLIEKVKTALQQLVNEDLPSKIKLSKYLTGSLPYGYTYLSNLFSEVEGTTIEKYLISLRIEKAKELLVYDELTLAEIAHKLGYSSSAYLSNQFRQVTGLTPSHFKTLKANRRRNIEDL